MMRLTIYGILICIGIFFANTSVHSKDVPLPVIESTNYMFAGFTDERTNGAGNYTGIYGMNAKCVEKFGLKARMATTTEYYDSAPTEQFDGLAWIRLDVIGVAPQEWKYYSSSDKYVVSNYILTDKSGAITGKDNVNCLHWMSASEERFGAAISGEDGETIGQRCLSLLYIACSVLIYQ